MKRDYTLIISEDGSAFEEAVAELTSKGWELHEGLKFTRNKYGEVLFCQALLYEMFPNKTRHTNTCVCVCEPDIAPEFDIPNEKH